MRGRPLDLLGMVSSVYTRSTEQNNCSSLTSSKARSLSPLVGFELTVFFFLSQVSSPFPEVHQLNEE